MSKSVGHRLRAHRGPAFWVAVAAAAAPAVLGCSKPKPGSESTGAAADASARIESGDAGSGATPAREPIRPRSPSTTLRQPPVDPRYQPAPKKAPPLEAIQGAVPKLAMPAGWQAHIFAPDRVQQERPVLLVLTPHAQPLDCGRWAEAARGGAFTICLNPVTQGDAAKPARDGSKDPLAAGWSAAARKALEDAKRRYPRHLAPGSVVTVGYANVESVVVQLARESPKFFSRLVLAGSADPKWDAALADHFSLQGGQRVLFLCEGAACTNHAVRGASWLRTAGIASRTVPLADAGLGAQLAWLVEGDPRWAYLGPNESSAPEPPTTPTTPTTPATPQTPKTP